jgi:hypothetical protein
MFRIQQNWFDKNWLSISQVMNFLSLLLNNKRLNRNGLKKSSFVLGSLAKDLKGITDRSLRHYSSEFMALQKPPRVSGNQTRGPSLMKQWPRRRKRQWGLPAARMLW